MNFGIEGDVAMGLSLIIDESNSMKQEKPPGLYIHIPFCLTKCHYCDFFSSTSIYALPDFLDALSKEMEMYRQRFFFFETVYLGGGTPSLLSPQQLEHILKRVEEEFRLASNPEVTIEANPADLNLSFLRWMHGNGINRINIGVQSFDEKLLDFLGRRHSAEQAVSAVEAARKAGFDNIGLDLMYAIPGQTMESWLDTLERAIAFTPEHLSCYQLTVESKTPLGRRHQAGEFPVPGEKLQHEFFMKTSKFLEEAGYFHYEVSNFARGKENASRHNQKYWDHSPYLGLGPSAHSFRNNQRWWNHRSIRQYLDAIGEDSLPIAGSETLNEEQLQLEALYLGLRTKRGISLREFKNRFGCDLLIEKEKIFEKLREEGLVSIRDGYLHPTRAGLAIADSLSLI